MAHPLKDIVDSIGNVQILLFMIFLSTCGTCMNSVDIDKQTEISNMYLESIVEELEVIEREINNRRH